MTVCYLGKASDHRDNFASLARSAGADICSISDSVSAGVYASTRAEENAPPPGRFRSKLARLKSQLYGINDPRYIGNLVRELDKYEVDSLVAFWGTAVLGDIIAVKRLRPRTRVFLNVLCHPTALSSGRIAVQNWLFRRHAGQLDGVIASNSVMESYLHDKVLGESKTPCLIWPPYLSKRYHPCDRLLESVDTPNVFFMGRMDWWHGQACDNVTSFLCQLMNAGIHVHYSQGGLPTHFHPFGHTFAYRLLADAVKFSTQFDASLIVYNIAACGSARRFSLTVPDRLIASVAAGIPVALPRTGFEACWEYLRDYGGTLAFESAGDLADQLKDRAHLESLKRLARADCKKYVAEDHARPLFEFIGALPAKSNYLAVA